MRIVVLGGSPKGETSVTIQYVEYLKRKYRDVTFDLRYPAIRIRRLESDPAAFDGIIDGVAAADGVLWAFPLYVHGVCSQYQRFIELIDERDAAGAFAGKPAASLSTSIHFFDNTAHDYIRSVCEDLGMPFAGSHSPKMDDLTKKEGRKAVEDFFELFLSGIRDGVPFVRTFPPRSGGHAFRYVPGAPAERTGGTGAKITIVADALEGNLAGMVERFRSNAAGEVTVVELKKAKIAGGCIGCLRCGHKNRCSWDGKDDVRRIYEEHVETADIFVMAAQVKGRWHSAALKAFVDRGFFHTHQPFLTGKQFGVLLDGPIATNPVLRDFFHAFPEWQGASLQGIAATDSRDSDSVDAAVDALARRCMEAHALGFTRTKTFLGVGGMDIFRDDIYGRLGMVFRADHKFYRKNGIYRTMPHKRPLEFIGLRIVDLFIRIPPIRKKMSENMRKFMLTPYRMMFKSLKLEPVENAGSVDDAPASNRQEGQPAVRIGAPPPT